jgi:hypothetical protein
MGLGSPLKLIINQPFKKLAACYGTKLSLLHSQQPVCHAILVYTSWINMNPDILSL